MNIHSIIAAVRAYFGMHRTCDCIVDDIQKKIDELTNAAKARQEQAAMLYAAADKLEQQADDVLDEVSKSLRVAGNFQRLIG